MMSFVDSDGGITVFFKLSKFEFQSSLSTHLCKFACSLNLYELLFLCPSSQQRSNYDALVVPGIDVNRRGQGLVSPAGSILLPPGKFCIV